MYTDAGVNFTLRPSALSRSVRTMLDGCIGPRLTYASTVIGWDVAQEVIGEVGLDMTRFPTPKHLVSWARLSPRTIQSGAKNRTRRTGMGNPYLNGALGKAVAAAARTDTFLGERYRRI